MQFPVISEQAAQLVRSELHAAGDTKEWLLVQLHRISRENPMIGDFFDSIDTDPDFRDDKCYGHSLSHGVTIYRLVEEEMKYRGLSVPLISPEVVGPVEVLLRRDLIRAVPGFRDLVNKNCHIADAIRTWTLTFEMSGDQKSVGRVILVGYYVYLFIKNQWEADELKKELKGAMGD